MIKTDYEHDLNDLFSQIHSVLESFNPMVTLKFDNTEINPNDVLDLIRSNEDNVSTILLSDGNVIIIHDPLDLVESAIKMFSFRELDCEIAFDCDVSVKTGSQEAVFSDLVEAANQIAILQGRV